MPEMVQLKRGRKPGTHRVDASRRHEAAQALGLPNAKPLSRATTGIVGRPTKYNPEMCKEIIALGESGASKTEMAEGIGVLIETLNAWAIKHVEFSIALKTARQKSQVWWETIGRLAASTPDSKINPTHYIFQMKNRFREDWNDTRETRITGAGGGPVEIETRTIDMKQLSDDQRAVLRAVLLNHVPHNAVVDGEVVDDEEDK
jgi:transposase